MSTLTAPLIIAPCLVFGVGLGVLVCARLSELLERRHDRIEHGDYRGTVTISWAGVSAPNELAD